MSEIFPIVTPDGQVIGQASRAHCHDGSRYDSDRESEMVHVFRTTYAGPFFWNDGEVMDGRFWRIYELREAMGKGILTPNLEMELLRFGFI